MQHTWQEYNDRVQEWLEKHPEATDKEIEEFCKELADELEL